MRALPYSLLLALTTVSRLHASTPAVPLAPTSLTVTSATKSAVALSWTLTDPVGTKSVVERKSLGAAWPAPTPTFTATATQPSPSTFVVVDGAAVTDAKIDAYATYVYRVRTLGAANALSAPSNEVIVGPPPVGFSSVLAAPKAMHDHDASQFANLTRLLLDANGDPSIGYVTYDLNNDGELPDTELAFITWNRARYRWNPPARVDSVDNVARSGSRLPFAIARDESSGTVGAAYLVGAHDLYFATSVDAGLTWTRVLVKHTGPEDPGLSTPALAMASGRVHLAYALGSDTISYRGGLVTDAPAKWVSKTAPKLPATDNFRAECVSLVLDAAGKPGVSYCMNPDHGYSLTVAFWRPETGAVVKVMDTNDKQNDDPAVHMASSGADIALGFYGSRDELFFANHHVWFTRSRDGGATFSKPVVVADDGGNAMGSPVTVALDHSAHVAMVAQLAGGNDGAVKCGLPKLMRSADGAVFSTCAPETRGLSGAADVTAPVLTFAGNDKLYVAQTIRAAAGTLPPGLVLWRER